MFYRKIGLLEFVFVINCILVYYSYGIAALGDIIFLIISLYILFFKRKYNVETSLMAFLLFFFLHEFILIFFIESIPLYFINNSLSICVNIFILGFLASELNLEKLYFYFVIVGLVCVLGIIYHFINIFYFGNLVTAIQLPFVPKLSESSRYYEESIRPLSFFPEPSSYATFMFIPLFLALNKRNWLIAVIFTLSILLSTSSNGFFLSLILWVFYIFNKSLRLRQKIFIGGCLLFIFYMILNSELFEFGIKKIEQTNYTDNARLTSGYNMFKELSFLHVLFGVNSVNLTEFVHAGGIEHLNFRLLDANGEVYVTTFWYVLMKFGIFGLLIYLFTYIKYYLKYAAIRPYIFILIIAMFSQSVFVSGVWMMQMVFVIVFCKQEKDLLLNKSLV